MNIQKEAAAPPGLSLRACSELITQLAPLSISACLHRSCAELLSGSEHMPGLPAMHSDGMLIPGAHAFGSDQMQPSVCWKNIDDPPTYPAF